MLYRANTAELRAKISRLLELAQRREALPEQRRLMAELGGSRRMAAVRPLVRSWACSAPLGRPKRRWFSLGDSGLPEERETADQALLALGELWAGVAPQQYNQLDQELRAGGYGSAVAEAAWWKLEPRSALETLPDSGEGRVVGLGVLSSHPSGHVREAASRELATGPLPASLPFLLVRANDWVRQVRAVAYARLLTLDERDVEQLAPWLELVQQLRCQGRREPGAVEHLLNLLRTPEGLDAVRDCWTSAAPSLRRAAVRFSWDEGGDHEAVLRAAAGSHDAMLRRWAVEVSSDAGDPRQAETIRHLARDPIPMVATAALDALEVCLERSDLELLMQLRCAPSPGLQHTARFMLEKHFDEASHRPVYLSLLERDDTRSRVAAAIGLAATGKPEDLPLLLGTRLGARSKVRQQLLRAAVALDPEGARGALFEDVQHELPGVSKAARQLLGERLLETDADAVSSLLGSALPHVRRNALLLAARLTHWQSLPVILRATRDPHTAETAQLLVQTWLARHFHGVYRPAEPTEAHAQEVRAELAACTGVLERSTVERVTRAVEGEGDHRS